MNRRRIVPAIIALSLTVVLAAQDNDIPFPVTEDENVNSIRRMPMHNTSYSFANTEDALSCDREKARYKSLNGKWEFTYNGTGANRNKGGWSTIDVPSCWEREGFGYPIYTNIAYPFKNTPPVIGRDNQTGLYMRTFTVPDSWRGKRVILHFGGVYSAHMVWINHQFAGYSEDSALPSEFDITPYLNEGGNSIKVKVWKWADGSYVEDADHWRMAGIYRDVYLSCMPEKSIYDFGVRTVMAEDMLSANLQIRPALRYWSEDGNDGMTLVASLFDADGKKATDDMICDAESIRKENSPQRDKVDFGLMHTKVENVRPWSAEDPYLYTLVLSLNDSNGNCIDARSCRVGFRDIRIAGEEILVNGKAVKLAGVNRHDHSEKGGKSVTREEMERDVKLMKRFNFNAIRTSHYPNDPYLYDLCDKYGLYVIDESNIETHEGGGTLANTPSWAKTFIERVSRMAVRDRNHPCIIFWSLGNESGMGPNHAACSAWLHEFDPTRPVHYEGAQGIKDDPVWVDMLSRMYPTLEELEELATRPNLTRPVIMCEYAHSMGNSTGGLYEYWELIHKYKRLGGGFIWDWIDQGLAETDAYGRKWWGYGGDYEDWEHHDGNFNINGIVFPDKTPKPAMYECKYVFQPYEFKLSDNSLSITNRKYFTGSGDCVFLWELTDGKTVLQKGSIENVSIAPGTTSTIALPLKKRAVNPTRNCYLNVYAHLKEDTPYAEKGWCTSCEQFCLQKRKKSETTYAWGNVRREESDSEILLKAASTVVRINKVSGYVSGIRKNGNEYLASELVPDFTRAHTDNDERGWNVSGRLKFWETASGNLKISSITVDTKNHSTSINVVKSIDGKISLALRYTLNGDGSLKIDSKLDIIGEDVPELLRFGLYGRLSDKFTDLCYTGRGPHENYRDRKRSAFIGTWSMPIEEMAVNYVRPQENGNRCDVSRITLSGKGMNLKITADEPLEFSVLCNSREELRNARHVNELCGKGKVHIHIDCCQTGVGGIDSWSLRARPIDKYRLLDKSYSYGFTIGF